MELLTEIESLVEQSRFLTALERGNQLGPLEDWPGPRGQIAAIRLANHLGGGTISAWLLRRAFRTWPEEPTVQYYHWRSQLSSRRLVRRWLELRDRELSSDASPVVAAHWLSCKATILGALRDHRRAHEYIERAIALAPEDPWVWYEKGLCAEQSDHGANALEAYKTALRLRPHYRPAAQAIASRLMNQRQDEEAIAILSAADEASESGAIRWHRSMLLEEMERYQESLDLLENFESFFPLSRKNKEKEWIAILAQRRCDLQCSLGNWDEAIHWGAECKNKFHETVTKNLQQNPEGKRTRLRVPFVQQSRMTCAPASLAMLCDYFQVPTTHDEIASRICYDGTHSVDERRWAEESGLVVREFRVTIESTKRLIEAGYPFTLQTVEPGSAHLQVIAGLDERRGTILIQDPGARLLREALATELLDRYAASGPAGLVIAPAEKREELESIELTDAELYDYFYRFQRALSDHQRDKAVGVLDQLKGIAPESRLVLSAESQLAIYDGVPLAQLAANEAMLAKFPEDEALALRRLRILSVLERSDALRVQIEEWLRLGKGGIFTWLKYAEILESARDRPLREYWLHRILSYQVAHADALQMLGDCKWAQGKREDAYELYRIAASCENKQEFYAAQFFGVSRQMGRTEEGLAFLRNRFEEFGSQSGLPGLTLARAYDRIDQQPMARQILDESMKLRPDDGELILGVVSLLPSLGSVEEARVLLDANRSRCRPVDWAIYHARLQESMGDPVGSLATWRKLAEEDSLYVDAHSQAARLLADIEGPDKAIEFVRQASDRHSNHRDLANLAISWLRSDHRLEEAESRLGTMLEAHPDDAWAYRERAIVRAMMNQSEGAIADAQQAIERDPSFISYQVLGSVYSNHGTVDQARDAYRKALEDSIDTGYAMSSWLRDCKTESERTAALDWILNRIQSQRTNGEGLITWYSWVQRDYHPDHVWKQVEEAFTARPDLWQTWSIRLAQLSSMRRHKEAIEFSERYVDRFPLLPVSWVDRADAARGADLKELEIASLQEAFRLNRNWSRTSVALALAQDAIGNREDAESTMRQALASDPRSDEVRLQFATLLEKWGRPQEGLEQLSIAASLSASNDDLWNRLSSLSEQLDQGKRARHAARQLCEKCPSDSRSWQRLAEMLHRHEHLPEAYSALERSIVLRPKSLDAYDLMAHYLVSEGRNSEAIAACHPKVFQGVPQPQLIWRESLVYEAMQQLPQAIESLRTYLKFNPSTLHGWFKLADWAEQAGMHGDYDAAALKMIELNPHNPYGYGYRSATLLRSGRRQEAIDHLNRALELDPNYYFAAYQLVQLSLEDRNCDHAQAYLDRAGSQLTPLQRCELQCRIDVARPCSPSNDMAATTKNLKLFLEMEDSSRWVLERVLNQADATQRSVLLAWSTEQMGNNPNAPRGIGQIWVVMERLLHKRSDRWIAKMLKKQKDSPAWQGAAEFVMDGLYESNSLSKLVSFCQKLKKKIQLYPELNLEVPMKFLRGSQNNAVASWCRGWTKDPSRPATDFLALIISQWNHDRIGSTLRLIREVAKRDGVKNSTHLQLWIGVSQLYGARFGLLRKQLEEASIHQLDEWYSWLYRLLSSAAMVTFEKDLDGKRAAYQRMKKDYDSFRKSFRDPSSRRIAHRCMAVSCAATGAKWKSWYHYFHSWQTLWVQ